MTLRRRAILALALNCSGALVWAQTVPSQASLPPATFEVASVKRSLDTQAQPGIRPINRSGRFHAIVTVRMLIQVAYGYPLAILDSQIVGGPAWMNQDRFEIVATPDGPIGEASNGPPMRLLSMVRALLADRFKLQLRRESRQMPIYELIVDRADGWLGSSLR